MLSSRKIIAGSDRVPPSAERMGVADPAENAEVSIYLKRPAGASLPPATFTTRQRMRQDREPIVALAAQHVAEFAKAHGLAITLQDPARRLVKVAGSIGDLQAAFGTQLHMYGSENGSFRGRAGPLTAPGEVAELVEAVLGLDQRPAATPKSIRLAAPHEDAGNLPTTITERYGFPTTPGRGAGECIAIIELGGGVSDADTAAAFKAMALQPPKVAPVLVSGGTNIPGKDPNADAEVALDVQVAGAGAPGATLAVYFAPNTDQGFVDAISQAAHDATHKPSVMSISWGSAESDWTMQAVAAMTSAFQDAAELGVSVFAASGDGLATDGQSDGRAHVDFPASSPWIVGCGGTHLSKTAETVWNSNGAGTGGGISTLFAAPGYQANLKLPAPADPGAKPGRGVPDVAGDADPATGYRVVVDGKAEVIGGTSAVAPLWAGLFALVNELAGHPSGQPHALLYAHPEAFIDIRRGDNRAGGVGYKAAKGWDACTGLGAPRAGTIASLFQDAAAGSAKG